MENSDFIEAVWGGIDRGYILIWRLSDKISTWCSTVADANKVVENNSNIDLYVGVGLSSSDQGPTARCKADEVIAIPGMWADVDIMGPAHKKRNLPIDEPSAHLIIESVRLKPTIIIHSGHGLQAWWLFKEPWYLEKVKEKEQAQVVASKWQRLLSRNAQQLLNADVDKISDLARVLRIPGTMNCKIHDDPVAVRILSADGPRYADINPFEEAVSSMSDKKLPDVRITLNANANPPVDKFEILKMTHKKFSLTWDRKRTDFSDSSPSSYCWALAVYSVKSGWSDQDVADLLVAWRRKEKEDLKLDRPDWYAVHIIAKVRAELEIEQSKDWLSSSAPSETIADTIPDDPGIQHPPSEDEVNGKKKQDIIDSMSRILQIPMVSFIQHGVENAVFSIKFESESVSNGVTCSGFKEIELGHLSDVRDFDKMFDKIQTQPDFIHRKHVDRPAMGRDQWRQIVNHLNSIKEIINPEVGDPKAMMCAFLEEYWNSRRHRYTDQSEEGISEALMRNLPFFRKGAWCVHADSIREWLDIRGHKWELAQIWNRLRFIGFVRKPIALSGVCRSYWSISRTGLDREGLVSIQDPGNTVPAPQLDDGSDVPI